MYPSQVNAYYNPPANEVCILRSLLFTLFGILAYILADRISRWYSPAAIL